MIALQCAVSDFCKGISADTDDAVIQYLTGIVQDACEGGDADISDVEELVHGFLPDIAKLSQQDRHDRLWSLLTKVAMPLCLGKGSVQGHPQSISGSHPWSVLQVHTLLQRHDSPKKQTERKAPAALKASEKAVAPQTSAAKQNNPEGGTAAADISDREHSHSEEHQQAIATLSALWPADVPMEQAFVESILDIQCQGDLEVGPLTLCLLATCCSRASLAASMYQLSLRALLALILSSMQ